VEAWVVVVSVSNWAHYSVNCPNFLQRYRRGKVVEVDQDLKLDFRDVLIRPRPSSINSRKDVSLTRAFQFPRSSRTWAVMPLIASNMDSTGTIAMAKALAKFEALTAISKYIDAKAQAKFFGTPESAYAFFSMGATSSDLDRLNAIKSRGPIGKISIEVANGYIEALPKFIATVRKENPKAIILAGSVCTPEGTINLLRAGADIARVGIGPGSVCITRKITGIGYPQLSATIECAEAAHMEGGLICSDGGCTVPGDVCKAFGAGADFVMLGGMLAGHEECYGQVTYKQTSGKKIPVSMTFYGMASDLAQKKHYGGKSSYSAAEGKTVSVPYRGRVADTIAEILGGIRSMMTYINAPDLASIPAQTQFVRVGAQLNTVFDDP
jgi:GMP reductase